MARKNKQKPVKKGSARKLRRKKKETLIDKNQSVTTKEIIETSRKPIISTSIEMLSTGIDLFDLALGGGHGVGKVINLVGDKSSGKTLLAMEFIAYCRHSLGKKFRWFYDDAESGFAFNSKQLYGFELIPEEQECSHSIEEFNVNFKKQIDSLRKGETFVYVLDSLDSMTSLEERQRDKEDTKKLEAAMENNKDLEKIKLKGTYGMERQKKLSQFFRIRSSELNDKRAILIVISQVRTNINVMFGEKYVRTGGKALDFYASQIIWLAELRKHRRRDRVVGITIKARVKKNKLGKPFRECFLDVLFDYGVDNVASNAKFLFDLVTDEGKEREMEIAFNGQEFKTLRDFIHYVEKHKLQKKLSNAVKEKWNEIEDSISTKDRVAKWEDE